MKEIVLDFRRYSRLGFTTREAIDIARTRLRTRQALRRSEQQFQTPVAVAGGQPK